MSLTDTHPDVVRFHGHECPGAAVGARMAEAAIARLGRHATGNELYAISETDSCAVDSVQVLTGCTYGKRNLVHEDHGKYAVTFWRRTDGAGVRVIARPGSEAYRNEQTWELAEKVEAGTATAAEFDEFVSSQAARLDRILATPTEDLLIVEELTGEVPAVKPVRPTEPCDDCGEETSVAILHNHRGRMICPPCHLAAHGGELPPDHGHHDHGHAHPRAHTHNHGHSHDHSHGHSHSH